MSFFSRDVPARAKEDGSTLDSILNSPELRTELALLVSLCSDIMRRNLMTTFDIQSAELPASLPSLDPFALDETTERATSAEKKDRRAELQRMESAEMQGLKRAATTFFDKWQISVLRRLGDVLNIRSDAVRKARATAREKAEQKAKAARDEAYFAWAEGRDAGEESGSRKDSIEHNVWGSFETADTTLIRLDEEKRTVILNALLLMLLSLERYTAHSRTLLQHVASSLDLASTVLATLESEVAETLMATAAASSTSTDESTKRAAANDAANKRWKVGLATFAGAAVIGLTGGLAAPLLAAGAGALMGGLGLGAIASLLGPLATNMVLVGGLFGAYGGRMTGKLMEKYEKEVDDFRFIPIKAPRHGSNYDADKSAGDPRLDSEEPKKRHKLRVAIGISGWLTSPSEVIRPWRVLSNSSLEPFGLRYELEALLRLGESLLSVLRGYAWDFAKFRLLTLVFAGLWPLGLLRIASLIDSPFIIAKARTDKAGKVLADALIHKVQGERPVTLVGYSLGARVIHSCLLELAAQNAFGLVEGVVLMGSPIPSDPITWRKISSVVAGKIVNVYSEADFLLGFMYRATSVQLGVAGLQPVQDVARVTNINVTAVVKEHTRYRYSVGGILRQIGFTDLDEGLVDKQLAALKKMEQKEEQEHSKQREEPSVNDGEKEDGIDPNRLEQIKMVDTEEEEKKRLNAAEEDMKERKRSAWLSKDPVDQGTASGYHLQDTRHGINSMDEGADREDAYASENSPDEGQVEVLTVLAPEAEADIGPDLENLHFGTPGRGINVTWDSR